MIHYDSWCRWHLVWCVEVCVGIVLYGMTFMVGWSLSSSTLLVAFIAITIWSLSALPLCLLIITAFYWKVHLVSFHGWLAWCCEMFSHARGVPAGSHRASQWQQRVQNILAEIMHLRRENRRSPLARRCPLVPPPSSPRGVRRIEVIGHQTLISLPDHCRQEITRKTGFFWIGFFP